MGEEQGGVFYDTVMLGNASTKEAVISQLADILHEGGYVTDEYKKATLEREVLYPTGLPTTPFAIAVPHSERENVVREAVIVGICGSLVEFAEMGKSDSTVDVGVVFLLALKGENSQVNYLRNIVNYCKHESELTRLRTVGSAEEACQILVNDIFNVS
jgi:PTS system galactitol-specific IIA component